MIYKHEISKETLVWCQGMANWDKAENLQEFQSLFNQSPPPPPIM
jgi:hypothetical protein